MPSGSTGDDPVNLSFTNGASGEEDSGRVFKLESGQVMPAVTVERNEVIEAEDGASFISFPLSLAFIPQGNGELKEIPGIGTVLETSEEDGKVTRYPITMAAPVAITEEDEEGQPQEEHHQQHQLTEEELAEIQRQQQQQHHGHLPSFNRFLLTAGVAQRAGDHQQEDEAEVVAENANTILIHNAAENNNNGGGGGEETATSINVAIDSEGGDNNNSKVYANLVKSDKSCHES